MKPEHVALLEVLVRQENPECGRYSQLSSAQLWRLHFIRRGRVPGLAIHDVESSAAFIGVPDHELRAHLAVYQSYIEGKLRLPPNTK